MSPLIAINEFSDSGKIVLDTIKNTMSNEVLNSKYGKIFNNIFDGDVPDDIEVKLNTLRSRLSLKSNTIGMKKIIGEKTIQADGYPIKNS